MSRPPIYIQHAEAPGYRQVRPFRWKWSVRDSSTGPVLAEGHTITSWGARRRIERVVRRCVCVAGDCRADRPVLRPLSAIAAQVLSELLQRDGVPVTVRVDGPDTVVLWPALALTSEQEAQTLHAVLPKTDAPVRWAGVA